MLPDPPTIDYAGTHPAESPTIERADGNLYVNLGRPSSAVLAARVFPLAAILGAIIGGYFYIKDHPGGMSATKLAACLSFTVIVLIYGIVSVVRRHARFPQHIFVRNGELAYSNPMTAGVELVVAREKSEELVVRRDPLAPWVVNLIARPRPRAFALSSSAPPIVLATSADRSLLRQISSEIRRALGEIQE